MCGGSEANILCACCVHQQDVNSNADSDTLTVHKGEELNCDVLVFMGGASEANIFSTLL
jgi:hypothetical protein